MVVILLCRGFASNIAGRLGTSRDHRNAAFVILKRIGFGALRAQPEVFHRVRGLGLFAFPVRLVKTEDSTLPIHERSRTGRVCAIRNHQDFPRGVRSNMTAPLSIAIRPPDNQTHKFDEMYQRTTPKRAPYRSRSVAARQFPRPTPFENVEAYAGAVSISLIFLRSQSRSASCAPRLSPRPPIAAIVSPPGFSGMY